MLLCIASSIAQAESFVYIGADPSSAKGDFMNTSDATIDGEPFWQVMEQYIGREGACQNPSIEATDLVGDVKSGQVVIQYQIEILLNGLNKSKNWLESKTLWPLKSHNVIPQDPRAPKQVPIFCSLNAAPVDNPVTDILTTKGFDGASSYLIVNGQLPESGYYSNRMLSMVAVRALMKLLAFDILQDVLTSRGVHLFGKGSSDAEQALNLRHLRQIANSLFNSMTFGIAEEQYGYGPNVIDNLVHRESKAVERNFFHLAGDYTEPFYSSPHWAESNRTSAAFWNFLFDGYLTVGYDSADDLIYALSTSQNQLKALDKFIDDHDGEFHKGLIHALPNFAAVVSKFGYYRNYKYSQNWIQRLWGECEIVTLSENQTVSKTSITLKPYTSKCIKLNFEPGKKKLFDAHIQIDTGDDKVDGVELSSSQIRASEVERVKKGGRCYSHLGFQTGKNKAKVEKRGLGANATCLLAFGQGREPGSGLLKRYFYLNGEKGDTTNIRAAQFVLMISYVPKDPKPFNEVDESAINTRVIFSVDSASIESKVVDEKSITSSFGSKNGSTPITPAATDKTDQFDESVIEGKSTAVDPAYLKSASKFSDNSLGLQDDFNTAIEYKFQNPNIISSKSTGEFEVIPVFQKEGYLAIPSDRETSKINIIKHDKDTLYFEADAHICMVKVEELMPSMHQRHFDICDQGEQHQIKSIVTIPFPDQFRSSTRIEWEETDNYQASRAIRLNRIKQAFAVNGLSGVGAGVVPSNDARQSADQSGEAPALYPCALFQASGACDCSCDVKRCVLDSSELRESAQGLACRLSCGKKWKRCAAQ